MLFLFWWDLDADGTGIKKRVLQRLGLEND